jgi:hypothetical protein
MPGGADRFEVQVEYKSGHRPELQIQQDGSAELIKYDLRHRSYQELFAFLDSLHVPRKDVPREDVARERDLNARVNG